MEISALTLKLIILLIPGAIATRVYQKITIHSEWTSFQFVANSILFGTFSYLITLTITDVISSSENTDFWQMLTSKTLPYSAILWACLVALLIGFCVSAIDHFKLLNWVAKKIKVSNKYGDENLYSYFLNADNVNEVYIRDYENNLTYHGLVDSFSETEEICEIVLLDVAIYSNKDGTLNNTLDKVYLARPKNNLTIELPITLEKNEEPKPTTETKC
jgi:hypothetical protein